MRRLLVLLGLGLIGVAPLCASPQATFYEGEYRVAVGIGPTGASIDWAQKAIFVTVRATSPVNAQAMRARAAAREVALAAARRDISEFVSSMKVTGYATIGEAMRANLIPRAAFNSVINAVIPVADTWNPTGRELTLTCALPLTGAKSPSALAARMLTVEQRSLANPVTIAPKHVSLFPKLAVQQPFDSPYTGIVLDCTGAGYIPALLPKLFAQDGSLLWNLHAVNTQAVQGKGLVGFATSLDAAVASRRVGARPLIIRPLGSCGPLSGDLILRPEDAALLAGQPGAQRLLSTLAVAILVD